MTGNSPQYSGMTHKVLQRFGIHTAFCLVGAVGMTAHMGCNQGKLFLVNAVVLFPGVLEVMLPMHCHHRAVILVKEQESRIAVNGGSTRGGFLFASILWKQA